MTKSPESAPEMPPTPPLAPPAAGRRSASECVSQWSLVHQQTLEIRRVWPEIWSAPASSGFLSILPCYLAKESKTLLDVGASSFRDLPKFLAAHFPSISYKSFDVDARTRQDYYSWSEIPIAFDAAVCGQVLEHLTMSDGLECCQQVFDHLNPLGLFFVTVPNVFHPNRQLTDPSHVTPWCYDKLGGALLALGFEVLGIHRYGCLHKPRGLKDRLMSAFVMKLRRRMGIDFANSICVVARRPAQPADVPSSKS